MSIERRHSLLGHAHTGTYAELVHTHVKADITDFAHTHVVADITDLSGTLSGYLPTIPGYTTDLNVTNVSQQGEWATFNGSFGAANDPGVVSNYYSGIETQHWLSGTFKTQLAFGTTDGDLQARWMYDGVWGAWRPVWNSLNDGAGSGLDADLLDGVEGANYTRVDLTNLGASANGLNSVTNTAAEWGALPVGYSCMMDAGTIGTAGGAPINSGYGYFTKVASRDVSNGWGGLWTGYDGGDTYVGYANTNALLPTWHKVWTQTNLPMDNHPAMYIKSTDQHLRFYETDGPDANDFGLVQVNGGAFALYVWDNSAGTYRLGINQTISTGALSIGAGSTVPIGFFGSAGVAKPTVTGSKGANAALTSLCTALANLGLITNSTT